MTENVLTLNVLISVLKKVADDMKGHIEELRQLDAIVGDGDLGVTVELGSNALSDFLETTTETDIGKLLGTCGMTFNKASPSTFGTLLASGFLAASQAARNKQELAVEDLVVMANGAIDGIKRRGKAEVGDKTMLDSLVPAVESFEREINNESSLTVASAAAITAAEEGMKATTNMKAKHGRASWHQEKTIGLQDAGATAMYYLIESFAKHLGELTSAV